jgi:TM2 domain-containing membrane protein YozV
MAGPRFCSSCGHPVVVGDARFCKDCGAALATGLRFKHDLDWNPWLAASLSLIPGLGQFYKGQRLQAVLWFIVVPILYTAGPIGPLLHLVCIANAALGGAIDFPGARFSATPARGADSLANRQ